jgi:hypothetical protein
MLPSMGELGFQIQITVAHLSDLVKSQVSFKMEEGSRRGIQPDRDLNM